MYKVLIIDDVVLVRDAIKLLGHWDLFGITEILEAGNAEEGMKLIYQKRPELIIPDMKMPVMDGSALLTRLDKEQIRSKVIVISGYSDFKYTRLAIQSKVIDYILKPIDPQDLNNSIAAAMAEIEKEFPVSVNIHEDPSVTGNQLINEVIHYIGKHYMEDISLSLLADTFYLSKEHLSRLFKKETGTNLFSYIMELKLNDAKELLTSTEMTLDEIAFKLGFSNGNYFSKVFKKNTGQSPRDYRSTLN